MKAKNRRNGGNVDFRINLYYLNIATKLRYARYAALCALFTVMAVALTAFPASVNANNLGYLIRYVDSYTRGGHAKDYFKAGGDAGMRFGMCADNVVMLGKSAILSYDPGGISVLNKRLVYASPALVCSGSRTLAYDLGGRELEVFGPMASLYKLTSPTPIYGAILSAQGHVAYFTHELTYRSVLKVLSPAFEPSFVWRSADKYISAIDLSGDGKSLAVANFVAKDGQYESEILIFDTSSEDYRGRIAISDALIIGIKLFPNGGVAAITDSDARFYDAAGVLPGRVPYESGTLEKFAFGEGTAVLVIGGRSADMGRALAVYGIDGVKLREARADGEVLSLFMEGDDLYYTTSSGLYILDAARHTRLYEAQGEALVMAGKYLNVATLTDGASVRRVDVDAVTP